MKIQCYATLTVRDAEGKIIQRRRLKIKSFVKQFLQLLEVITSHSIGSPGSTLSVRDTTNTLRTLTCGGTLYAYSVFAALSPAGNNAYGIVAGTGTTAEGVEDYALATIIAHGTGAGQLSYGATSYTTATVSDGNVDLIFTRTFVNGSGGTVTVQEIGLYFAQTDSGLVNRYFCGLRDLTGAISVGNGQTLTVQYDFRTTV